MKTLEELMQQYGEVHPIFDHFGCFTSDRDRVRDFLLTIPGAKITADRYCEFTEDDVFVGKPQNISIYHIDVAGQDVEVIQPVNCPESYSQEMVDKHGECFHHLCLTFKTNKEHWAMCHILEENGYVCRFASNIRDLVIHYYESSEDSTVTYELKSVRES